MLDSLFPPAKDLLAEVVAALPRLRLFLPSLRLRIFQDVRVPEETRRREK